MADVGDLVRTTDGRWMIRPPTHCPNGHQLGPGRTVVSYQPCSCRHGHTTWTCEECNATVYGPKLGDQCRVLNGPAEVRVPL